MTSTATAVADSKPPAPAGAAQPGADLPLTQQQLDFFDTFGYLVLPDLIQDCIEEVTADFQEVWQGHGGGHDGKPHDGATRSCLVPFIDQHERLSMLLDHPGVHGAAVSLLGEGFAYLAGDGNYYVGDTLWHVDNMSPERRFIKFSFYLDALDADSGALRVVPGSHHVTCPMRQRLLGKTSPDGLHTEEAYGVPGAGLPAVALATRPGDVVVFNQNLYHSSWGGGQRRRMFTMNCTQRYAEDELPQLQGYLVNHARFLIERNVGPAMLRVATPACGPTSSRSWPMTSCSPSACASCADACPSRRGPEPGGWRPQHLPGMLDQPGERRPADGRQPGQHGAAYPNRSAD